MTQIATVRAVTEQGLALVQIRRMTACGHDCADCAGCTQVITGENVVMAQNGLNARAGDLVLLESETSKVLAAASVVYLVPFLLFFVCYFILGALGSNPDGTTPIIGGLAGFALGIAGAVWWDRREKRKRTLQFKIVEIKKRCSDM